MDQVEVHSIGGQAKNRTSHGFLRCVVHRDSRRPRRPAGSNHRCSIWSNLVRSQQTAPAHAVSLSLCCRIRQMLSRRGSVRSFHTWIRGRIVLPIELQLSNKGATRGALRGLAGLLPKRQSQDCHAHAHGGELLAGWPPSKPVELDAVHRRALHALLCWARQLLWGRLQALRCGKLALCLEPVLVSVAAFPSSSTALYRRKARRLPGPSFSVSPRSSRSWPQCWKEFGVEPGVATMEAE